jgi:hypothetical protein
MKQRRDDELAENYRINRYCDGQGQTMYEILYKGQRIEAGGPFVTRTTAVKLLQQHIYGIRNRRK